MAPISSPWLMPFAFIGASLAVAVVEDGLIFDDECGAHAPCALELLQLSQQKISKHPHASLVSQPIGFANYTDALIAKSKRQPELFALLDQKSYPEIDDGVWTFDIPRSVKITSWTGEFYMGSDEMLQSLAPNCHYSELDHGEEDITFYPPWVPGHKGCCQWEYVITDTATDISEYDVVLFYLPYVMRTDWKTSMPATKKEGQLWIATCGEPMYREETFMDCRLANDTDFMELMDGFSSYSGTSDFPSFFDTPSEEQMRLDPPDFAARGNELVTMTMGDCLNPERNEFMQTFMDEFKAVGRSDAILSYGTCFHNAEEVLKGSCGEPWYNDPWTNRCSSRPFKIVAENTINPWYVSEKIWSALFEGAIPIYHGPKEARRLVPPNSVIFADDYDGPASLAQAVLDFTEEDFKKFRAWKTAPTSEWNEWSEARRNGHVTLLPRLCEAAAKAGI